MKLPRFLKHIPDKIDLKEGLLILLVEALLLGLLFFFASCERRELYVYGDEFHSVELEVDWRKYQTSDPDGMTVWFYALDDTTHAPYRTTSASVRHQDIYLPGGHYQGVVIDYSPEEYSRQEFLDMEQMQQARVKATMASYQPDSLTVVGEGVSSGLNDSVNRELFGEAAWNAMQNDRPGRHPQTGFYIVANQPEQMGLDTLDNKFVDPGEFGDYIPWKERNNYQDKLVITKLYSEPQTIVWKMRIRIWIQSGYNYLWQNLGSISGLADGHYLARDTITDDPCLMFVESWEGERTGENSGYIAVTINTFGLRPESIRPDRVGYGTGTNSYYINVCDPEQIRLNLAFVLRDHQTLRTYHFDVGRHVVEFDGQLVLRVDIGPDDFWPNNPNGPDPIILPYVDAYNGTGFGADVTPWDEQPPVDVEF